MRENISDEFNDRIIFRKDSNGVICVYDLYKKITIRCAKFGKEHIVPDTGRDRAQQRDAEGFIRIWPKRVVDI